MDIPFLLWPSIHLDVRAHTNRRAQRLYRMAAVLFCHSELERQWLLQHAGVPPERAQVLGYGWNGDPASQPCRTSTTSVVRFLTVGAFVPHKQFDHQLKAIAGLRRAHGVDARLTIAGAASDNAVLRSLIREVRRRELTDCVELRSDCSGEEIVELHTAANYFLFTSRSESFGIALLEAIGWGTVPIVYPHPVYRQQVESSGFGIVAKQSNPQALIHAALLGFNGGAAGADAQRRQWLAERSWPRIVAPLAEALSSRLPAARH